MRSTKSGGRCVRGTPLGAGETAVTSAKRPSWAAGTEEMVHFNWEWEESGPRGLFTDTGAGGKEPEGNCSTLTSNRREPLPASRPRRAQ